MVRPGVSLGPEMQSTVVFAPRTAESWPESRRDKPPRWSTARRNGVSTASWCRGKSCGVHVIGCFAVLRGQFRVRALRNFCKKLV